jgi:Xaa-Pro aminopeptidase
MQASVVETKAKELRAAQEKAHILFQEIEQRDFIRPSVSESALNAKIYALAEDLFGIKTYWHKRIVRSGPNTLLPYAENPPDRELGADDIVFLDFGPVFEQWEADFGRTFVLGQDPVKHRLRRDVESAFSDGKQFFRETPDLRASDLFHHVVQYGEERGWQFGGPMAGHLIGQFPHERIPEDKISLYIHPRNPAPIRQPGIDGLPRHWILEIHFVDRPRQIGAFFEELLTVG